MIEENENIDLVTMRRQQEMQRAQESYRQAVVEGRLDVRPRQGEATDGRAALVAADYGGANGPVATSGPHPEVVTSTTVPGESVPVDPEVWIWQKRTGR